MLLLAPIAAAEIVLLRAGGGMDLGQRLRLYAPLLGGLIAVFAVVGARLFVRAELTVDSSGVSLIWGRRRFEVAWPEIAQFALINSRFNGRCVRVICRDELASGEAERLIPPLFGLTPEALLAGLEAGRARWGAAAGPASVQRLDRRALADRALAALARTRRARFAIILILLIPFTLAASWELALKGELLAHFGVETTAVITARYHDHDKHGWPLPKVRYALAAGAGGGTGRKLIGEQAWAGLAVGSPVRAVYLPSAPMVSDLNLSAGPYVTHPGVGLTLLAVIMTVIAVVLWAALHFDDRARRAAILAEAATT